MSNKRILVIDDDETIIEIISTILESNGYEPLTAENGKVGLETAINEKPDGIVLDKLMPEMDGNEVLEKLKENPETQDIPVVMLTAKNHIMEVAQSLEMGANDYIVKPFDSENFIMRVKHAMGK